MSDLNSRYTVGPTGFRTPRRMNSVGQVCDRFKFRSRAIRYGP
jgi:hypothetical protein